MVRAKRKKEDDKAARDEARMDWLCANRSLLGLSRCREMLWYAEDHDASIREAIDILMQEPGESYG